VKRPPAKNRDNKKKLAKKVGKEWERRNGREEGLNAVATTQRAGNMATVSRNKGG